MRLNEKIQFKLRNFFYEQDRKQCYKGKFYKSSISHPDKELGVKANFKEAIEEMDTYLGEKLKDIQFPKMKK